MSTAMTPEKLRQVLDLRKSNATQRHRSGKEYRRKPKHAKNEVAS